MSIIPIIYKNVNLEILTKLLNSVATRYGCRVDYIAVDNRIVFEGDQECCRHITEEALAFFPARAKKNRMPLNCCLGENLQDAGTEIKD